jgi:hypothetical protein
MGVNGTHILFWHVSILQDHAQGIYIDTSFLYEFTSLTFANGLKNIDLVCSMINN